MSKSSAPGRRITPKRIMLSVLLSCAVTRGVLYVLAVLVSRELLPMGAETLYAVLAVFLGAAAGSAALAAGVQEKKALAIPAVVASLLTLLVLAGLAAGKGSLSPAAMAGPCAGAALGGITGCILTAVKPHRRKRQYK